MMRITLLFVAHIFFIHVFGQNTFKNVENIYWWHIKDFRIGNAESKFLIQEIELSIKNINRELEFLQLNDSDAKPKGPFETTSEYELRKQRFENKVSQFKELKLAPLLTRQNEFEHVYLKQKPSSLLFEFQTEKYNADKGEWDVKIKETYSEDFKSILLQLSPSEAEQLWLTKNRIKVYEAEKLLYDKNTFYLIEVPALNEKQSFSILLIKAVEQNSPDLDKIVSIVEIEAEFPGGSSGWARYVTRNIELNIDELQKDNKSGTVVVLFTVDKDGKPSDVRALNCWEARVSNCLGPNSKLAEVAVAAIKKGPNWKPAVQNGRNVKSYRRQPVTFRLSEELPKQ